MKAIREAAGQDLQWKRTKWWKNEFELRSGDEVLAMLHATSGEAADGRWAFKSRSFWNRDIVITELDSQAEIAVVKRGLILSSIGFSDGRMLTWNNDDWDWVDSDGRPLIHFQRGKHVVLEPLALSLPELSLLVIVGRHLMELQGKERAAASTG